jgi:hypothetical protein
VGGVQLDSESDRINAPAGEPFRQFLTGEGGLELTGLRHLVLPERPVAESGRWSHASQVRLATGTFQCETTCQLTGQHTRDDRKLSKVTISWKLSPQAETAPPLPGEPERKQPMRIEKQKNEGMLLFDAAAGHPVEATFQQRMTVISQAGTSEVRQQITSNTKTTVARGSD